MSSLRISTTLPSADPSGPCTVRTRSLCVFSGFSAMNSSTASASSASRAGGKSNPSKPLP